MKISNFIKTNNTYQAFQMDEICNMEKIGHG